MEYLLEKLKAGTQNVREVTLPNSEHIVKIRLLTAQDILDATIAADRIFADAEIPVSLQNIRVYEAEKDIQCLFRACSDVNDRRLAKTITDFRAGLTVSARDFLISEYDKLDAECNPSLDKMTTEEFDTLLESVKKNPTLILNVSNIETLKRLVESLVKQSAK